MAEFFLSLGFDLVWCPLSEIAQNLDEMRDDADIKFRKDHIDFIFDMDFSS